MFEAPHSILLCEISRHAIETPDKVALVEGEALAGGEGDAET